MQTHLLAQPELELFETPIELPTDKIRNAIICKPRNSGKVMVMAEARDPRFIDSFQESNSHMVTIRLLEFRGENENFEIKWLFDADTRKMFVIMDDDVNPIKGVPYLPENRPIISNAIASLFMARGGVSLFDRCHILLNTNTLLIYRDDVCRTVQMCLGDGPSERFSNAEHFMTECYYHGWDEFKVEDESDKILNALYSECDPDADEG